MRLAPKKPSEGLQADLKGRPAGFEHCGKYHGHLTPGAKDLRVKRAVWFRLRMRKNVRA